MTGQGQATSLGTHIRAAALERALVSQIEQLSQEPAMRAYLLEAAAMSDITARGWVRQIGSTWVRVTQRVCKSLGSRNWDLA